MNIFTDEFVNKTHSVLKSKCFGSNTLFKKDLVKEIGFDDQDSKKFTLGLNLVSAMFELGYFKDYKVIPGKHGGIVHQPTFFRNVSESFPDNFLEKLFSTLISICHSEPISRNKIAQEMNFNLPEEQTINLISSALHKNYIIGFSGKKGKGGGIVRVSGTEPKLNIPNNNTNSFWDELRNEESSEKMIVNAK